MHRFFLPAGSFSSDAVLFPPETANQIRRVLRLRDGERVVALKREGRGFLVELTVDDRAVQGRIVGEAEAGHETPYRMTLLTPVTRREKFEWILQKCTEAGVGRFLPTISERSLIRSAADLAGKRERWEKIILEAAEQSGRDRVPELMEPTTFEAAIAARTEDLPADPSLSPGSDPLPAPPSGSLKVLFWEEAEELTLRALLEETRRTGMPSDVYLAVGPEGGYGAGEAAAARLAGWRIATLGKRILRMETAALAAVLLTNYGLEM